MKSNSLMLLTVLASFTFSCSSPDSKQATNETSEQHQSTAEETQNEPIANKDSILHAIDAQRATIENNLGEPVIISTATLREKIKQKWENIHFYSKDGSLVRIKTYPYKNITSRTEEFYLQNGKLMLVVIEDNGDAKREEENNSIDKMYYYLNGEFVQEVSNEKENDFTIKHSDSEELLAELNEYLEIYQSQAK